MSVAAPDPPVAVRHRRVGQERLPVPALILAVVAIAFFALPFLGLLWKAPWGDVWSILTSDSAITALRLSLWCSLWATLAALLFGVPLAWLLARVAFPGRGLVRALCTLSMVLPPVVAGVALFYSLGRRGLLGQYLDRVVRVHAAVHHRRRRRRPDVRRHAVPGASPSKRRSASSTPATRTPPAPSAGHAGTCSAASPCRPSAPG